MKTIGDSGQVLEHRSDYEDQGFGPLRHLPAPGAADSTRDRQQDVVLTIPQRPIRRRLQNVPRFVTTTGGECVLMPGISGLRWLADPMEQP
jgi:hypothetical protein